MANDAQMPERIWAWEWPQYIRRGQWSGRASGGTMEYVRHDLCAAAVDLADPVVVHVNMLRGSIAKLTDDQVRHLYPDLCASGQQVRALMDAAQTILDRGYVSQSIVEEKPDHDALRGALAALIPAPDTPQPEAFRINPEYQAIFDEAKARAPQPTANTALVEVLRELTKQGRKTWNLGAQTGSHWVHLGAAVSKAERALAALASHEAPQPAGEAVPVAWAYYWPDGGMMNVLLTSDAPHEGLRQVPLYAHPPQPSETVAEALKPFANMINHIETGTPDDYHPSWAEFLTVGDFRRAATALRALKGLE